MGVCFFVVCEVVKKRNPIQNIIVKKNLEH